MYSLGQHFSLVTRCFIAHFLVNIRLNVVKLTLFYALHRLLEEDFVDTINKIHSSESRVNFIVAMVYYDQKRRGHTQQEGGQMPPQIRGEKEGRR